MITFYYITCEGCKERLLLGQSGAPIYYGSADTLISLGNFFLKHEGHTLLYCDEHCFETTSYSTWPLAVL